MALSKRTIEACLAASIALALLPPSARCEGAPDLLQDPFNVVLGAFVINTDTKVRLDGDAGAQGTPVDWEETFGKGDVNRFRMDGFWRFADRHKLRALIFSSSQSDAATFDQDVDWGGQVFPADGKVNGEFKFTVYELAYEYAFLRRERYEISGSLGVHYTELTTTLAATLDVPDQTASAQVRESATLDAPLPVVGLHGTWALPHNLWIDASMQYFALAMSGVDGNLQDYKASLHWQPRPWLGVGVGYDSFSIRTDVDRSAFSGRLDWTYRGPMIFYSAAF